MDQPVTCDRPLPLTRDIASEVLQLLRLRFPEKLTAECSAGTSLFGMEGLGFDSLDAFELVVALESQFRVRIGELELYERRSIGDIAELIQQRL